MHKKPVVPFPGFKPAKPMVFAGIFPVDSEEFEILRDAIEKLTLNDASVRVEKTKFCSFGPWLSVWIFRIVPYGCI